MKALALAAVIVKLGVHDGLLVELRGKVPSKVLRHPPQLHVLEGVVVLSIGVGGVVDGGDEVVGLRALVVPAGARVLVGVVRLHRVPQPAHRVHHRHRPVPHGVELVEAAGLEAAGHEEDVAGGVDAVGHLHREPHPRAALVLVVVLHVPHARLVVLAARTQHHQLHVLREEPARRLEDLVAALLRVEAANEAHEGDVRVLRQPQLPLQRRLACRLAPVQPLLARREGLVAVRLDVLVDLRVPLVVVDAVDNAPHLPALVPQQRR
mmetsp:Transcript_26194/g.56828  ORF Transcript_26194/g.56828 Transcript_26194/m.56828 type:complete len:265 (-) Transcript_26194:1081-1875(-)